MSHEQTLSGQLYDALTRQLEIRGYSINRIAKEAGVSQPSLQDWYSGARQGLQLETAGKLGAYFGMRLTKPRIRKPDRPTANR